MKEYLDIVKEVINDGVKKHNRTGIDTFSISGAMFKHDMSKGFPLLTSKKMAYKNIFSELEFFIKGYHDKNWLIERKNHIWDEWCSPAIIPYSNNKNVQEMMKKESELGPIYGFQWRKFNASYCFDINSKKMCPLDETGSDQLKYIVDEIKNNPDSRRMICSAWNPNQMKDMALPPCHVLWQILINRETNAMDLIWYQRSVDVMLGLPFNIASYGALLELLCRESKVYKPGNLIGMLADVHIYENHKEGALIQLDRITHPLPKFDVTNFDSIFNFDSSKVVISNYKHEDKINFDIAV